MHIEDNLSLFKGTQVNKIYVNLKNGLLSKLIQFPIERYIMPYLMKMCATFFGSSHVTGNKTSLIRQR